MADVNPKGPEAQSAPEGGRKTITMVIVMMIMIIMKMTMMTMMIIMCFLHHKGPQTGLAPGGADNL